MNFDFKINSVSDVKIFIGADMNQATIQGNLISYDTSEDTKLHAVDKGYSSVVSSIDLLDSISANTWYHCQIIYVSQEKCLFYIDNNYIGEIDSHRYNQEPCFWIKSLDGTDKKLYIAHLFCEYYQY